MTTQQGAAGRRALALKKAAGLARIKKRDPSAPLSKAALQAYRRRHKVCEVSGCIGNVVGFSLYCPSHYHKALKYGSPTGRVVRYHERAPFTQAANRFVKANAEHPALLYAFEQIDAMLKAQASFKLPLKLVNSDWRSRLNEELSRLYRGGRTGRDVFVAVASVYLMHHSDERRFPTGRELKFAVSRAVVFMKDKGSRTGRSLQSHSFRVSTRVLENLGEELLRLLMPILFEMTKAADKAAQKAAENREHLVATIATQPFDEDEYQKLVNRSEGQKRRYAQPLTQPTN